MFDSDDSAAQIKDLLPPGSKPDAIDDMRNLISRAKNAGLSPEEALAVSKSPREMEAALLYQRYQARLSTFNAVDFDDLIRLPVQILESDESVRLAWRERIGYLLVDECQDTNDAQYRLLKALAGDKGLFTCVGDDDQSIYAWRGANPDNLLQLGKDYPALQIVKLEQNYRCSNRVLRTANALIAHNPHEYPKTLWSDQADGERIRVWECRDGAHEAEKVAGEIHFLAAAKQAPWSDFCILFRGNHQSRALEKALQLLRVPYHLSGGTAFLERGEVKDALAWLRLIANPDDDAAFLRAVQSPKREVGATTLAKLAELSQHAGMPMSRACEQIGLLKQLAPRASNALDGFANIIRHLRGEAQRIAPGELVRVLADKAACSPRSARSARTRPAIQRRKENLEELSDWFDGGKGAGPGRTGRAAGAAVARRQGRRRQPGAADVAARGQGPGVPLRLHRGHGGRHAAARDGAGGRLAGRRAAPALRRHHPRQGAVVALAFARDPALGRQDPPQAEPLLRRASGRRDPARRCRSRRRCRTQAGARRARVSPRSARCWKMAEEVMQLRRVHHVAIICSDYARSKHFYTQVLGLRVLAEAYREAREFVEARPGVAGRHRSWSCFRFRRRRRARRIPRPADCVIWPSRSTMSRRPPERLKGQGIEVEPLRVDEFTGRRFTFFADPDGLPIELYEAARIRRNVSRSRPVVALAFQTLGLETSTQPRVLHISTP